MAVYNINGNPLASVYHVSGIEAEEAYTISGELVYPQDILTDYEIFEPSNAPSGYTSGNSTRSRGDVLNVSTSQFLALFYDDYLTNPPTGVTVTKTSIGEDNSGTYDVYEYDFCPTNPTRLILLSSGMHPYELPASFGLANFINNLYSISGNDAFDYIRNHVRIKVIPIVNPWGFNQNPKKYGCDTGVNPNRNFDYNGKWNDFPSYTPSQNEWNVKGDYPFAIAETINLANWTLDNWTAEFWIDCHTDNASNKYDIYMSSLSNSKIATPISNAITNLTSWFSTKYSATPNVNHVLNSAGVIREYWSEFVAGVPTFTLEQSPCRTTFGTSAQNSQADIANYCTNLSTFVQELLLQEYVDNTAVAIVSASSPANVTIDVSNNGARSRTITATLSPSNTTQGNFIWQSSDESVCTVYGGTENAILVGLADGAATITGTNRHDSSIVVSCTVTVTGN